MPPPIERMTAQEIDTLAEDNAKLFKADGLKTNQIRNFYSAITRLRQDYNDTKQLSGDIERRLVFLKPKLAYSAGRQKAVRSNFFPFMKKYIEEVLTATDKPLALSNFFALVESVVAYHKFYGGE
jgi:CRISPR-associated protein Csm2